MNKKKPANDIFRFEHEVVTKCGILKERFHKISGNQWEKIYQKITDKYADKTKTWKNGLHWANINGYSPQCMKNLLGCYSVNYKTWFYSLPQIIPDDKMVYFLIDKGNCSWHNGEVFWIFESYIPELIKTLDLLNQTAFLDHGWLDYYIFSKKFQWLIGFNHHNIISCIGENLNLNGFKNQ